MRINYPGIADESVLAQLSKSIEVANWYHIQIWVKLQRALTGYFEELEDPELFEDFPIKDSDGSAFVALMGIDRSIAAWNQLYQNLPGKKEGISPLLQILLRLRPEVEQIFPKARDFQWPPKVD
jgi:hypothetical protein